MSDLTDIPVSELTIGHLGSRVVATRDGASVDGQLTNIHAFKFMLFGDSWSDPHVSLEIMAGNNTLKFEKLPLDYRVQVDDRPEKP